MSANTTGGFAEDLAGRREKPPGRIIIVGAGVFGLSTAHALLSNSRYDSTSITVLDQWPSAPPGESEQATPASIDNSRIIRPDYASKPYAILAGRAQAQWRSGWPLTLSEQSSEVVQPYRESGLLLICSDSSTQDSSATSKASGNNPEAGRYVDESLANVLQLAETDDEMKGKIRVCRNKGEVAAAMNVSSKHSPGDRGYINAASGWADAGAAMAMLRRRVRELIARRPDKHQSAPASFIEGSEAAISSLVYASKDSKPVATGVRLSSGGTMDADMIMVATGAWSPRLLPRSLGSRVKATGQAVGYVDLTKEEARDLARIPVALNLSNGLFVFPPIPEPSSDDFTLKTARHGWGYESKVHVPDTEPLFPTEDPKMALQDIEVSLPTESSGIELPTEGAAVMEQYLTDLGLTPRTWYATRTCWYADSATGDWLVDYVPHYGDSVFVATGDSGHAFKFAPVLGEWVVKAIERSLGEEAQNDSSPARPIASEARNERDEDVKPDVRLGLMLKDKWRWRSDEEDARNWKGCGDGSRGGPKGMRWDEEAAKGIVRGTGRL